MSESTVNRNPNAGPAMPSRSAEKRAPASLTAREMAVPGALLVLALIYPLLLTQIVGGSFLALGELDPAIYLTAASSNAVNQIFWLFLFAVSLLAAGMRRTPLMREAWALLPLLIYLAWSTATIPWAADRHIAMRRLVLQFCIVGSIWLPIAMMDSAERVRELVLCVFAFVVAANAASAVLVPPTELGFAGFFSQKNGLGEVAAMAFIAFSSGIAALRRRERTLCWLGILLAGPLLVASRSKTSLILAVAVPLLAGAIAAVSRGLRLRPGYVVSAVLAVAGAGAVFALAGGVRYRHVLDVLFNGDTFTGRTEIWDFAWSEFLTRPIAGFGFNGFWGTGGGAAATFSDNAFFMNILQAHNGYLDILLETGAVGFAIFVSFVTAAVGNCRRVVHMKGGVFFLSLALFFILHNFFESSAFRRFEPAWIVFLIVAVTVARNRPARAMPAAYLARREVPC